MHDLGSRPAAPPASALPLHPWSKLAGPLRSGNRRGEPTGAAIPRRAVYTTSTLAWWPGAVARRASRVMSGASSASANAM
jgi:hypothetical protein